MADECQINAHHTAHPDEGWICQVLGQSGCAALCGPGTLPLSQLGLADSYILQIPADLTLHFGIFTRSFSVASVVMVIKS